jgi:hypothetical protein
MFLIPAQMERLNMFLLKGIGTFDNTLHRLPPVLLGTIREGAGVCTAVDKLT